MIANVKEINNDNNNNPIIFRNCKINYFTTSFLLINYNQIWSPSLYNMISLNNEIPQDFIIFVLKNTFWLMFIPFTSSFKITLPSKLPKYYFSQVIMPYLVLLLCKFTTTTNNMIYTFIYFSTHST